jgi:hypothetical protein
MLVARPATNQRIEIGQIVWIGVSPLLLERDAICTVKGGGTEEGNRILQFWELQSCLSLFVFPGPFSLFFELFTLTPFFRLLLLYDLILL